MSIPKWQYTWDMLDWERREGGKESAEGLLEEIAEDTEEILSSHGLDIPETELIYDPEHEHLDENVEASVSYTPDDSNIDGIIFVGSESRFHPDSLAPRVSDTLAEEYMHIQFESVDSFEVHTGMGIDILGSVWALYTQDLIDDDEAVEEVAHHSKHGYENRSDQEGYGQMVEEGIYELVEDFRNASENRKMMEYVLNNPGALFEQYNEGLL